MDDDEQERIRVDVKVGLRPFVWSRVRSQALVQ
jgi:hypothetical protein